MRRYSRISTVVVAITVALLATACASGAPPTAVRSTTPEAVLSGTHDLKAGTYAFTFPQFDAPGKRFPKAWITVPDGWTINGGFALASQFELSRSLVVTIWDVADVYINGCHWLGPKIHPGPTAAELAAVLAGRPLRHATAPVAVSLGGYQGKYLQWSVPVNADFTTCDGSKFMSWYDGEGGDRYQQGPGQVDRLWILDIEGHRLVVDATYLPDATESDRAVLSTVVSSIVFKA